MAKMLEPDAVARPSMEQVFAHPWMQGPTPSESEVRETMQRLLHEKLERESSSSKGETHQEEYLGNDR